MIYCVLDPDVNLSDHLRVANVDLFTTEVTQRPKVKQLRWDHADLLSNNTTNYNKLAISFT